MLQFISSVENSVGLLEWSVAPFEAVPVFVSTLNRMNAMKARNYIHEALFTCS